MTVYKFVDNGDIFFSIGVVLASIGFGIGIIVLIIPLVLTCVIYCLKVEFHFLFVRCT
jgi:hypothetical protein